MFEIAKCVSFKLKLELKYSVMYLLFYVITESIFHKM